MLPAPTAMLLPVGSEGTGKVSATLSVDGSMRTPAEPFQTQIADPSDVNPQADCPTGTVATGWTGRARGSAAKNEAVGRGEGDGAGRAVATGSATADERAGAGALVATGVETVEEHPTATIKVETTRIRVRFMWLIAPLVRVRSVRDGLGARRVALDGDRVPKRTQTDPDATKVAPSSPSGSPSRSRPDAPSG